LTGWRTRAEAPEAQPGFDDSGWTTASHTATAATPYPPLTPAVLYADDYGFHYGNVWYRGHFTATGSETAINLNAITGKRGMYMVWLNGQYLGTAAGGTEADAGPPINSDPGPGTFAVPAGLLKPGRQALLSVLVEDMGDNDDWTAEEVRFRQPRGLYDVSFTGASPDITWKIQGALGGENLTDRARGPLNVGGLSGERNGWYLPRYPDQSWATGALGTVSPGVTWYRTRLDLGLPSGQDVPLALRFGGPVGSGYRVLIFLNGWNVGQYGAGIGPQADFALPAGLLRDHGSNTLALAVIAQQMTTVAPVSLAAQGNALGGVPVTDVYSPSYRQGVAP
jgi:beta-galactosidase GanA